MREAFAAGASGYVLKEAADTEVVDAVRGQSRPASRYVHPALGARLVAAESEERKRADCGPALRARARGAAPACPRPHEPGDCQQLYISVRTAETHRAHIMQKLRLSSRAELVRYAIDHGLVER